MGAFIGREKELEYLENIYSQQGLKTCAVYGRRQIGKSTLINEFCKGKRALTIQFSNRSEYENIIRIREDISNFLGHDIQKTESFTETISILANICNESKTVLVFDEYPYLTSQTPSSPSILQRFIDRDIANSDSMVIICGSSISMMRDEVENQDRPLYGRFVNRLCVGPLSFRKCMEFHKNMSDIDALKVYMTVGGIPKYHAIMNSPTYEKCIIESYINKNKDLSSEAESIISNELRPFSIYSGIIACIADGTVKQNEIADILKLDRPTCKTHLDKLEYLGMIERLHPMLGAPKRPIYRISDNILAFYYEVIRRHETMLKGTANPSLKFKAMEHDIETFMGHKFEDLCGMFIDEEYNVKERGKWWGKRNDVDCDIDIVAKIFDDNLNVSLLLSECKFTKRPMGFKAFNELYERASSIGDLDNVRFIMFSINGFESKLEDFASDNNITLVDANRLLGKSN